MIIKKTKNKMKYNLNDVFLYRLQQILYILTFIIPFPFLWLYGVCVDFNLNEPYDPRYECTFIPEYGEVTNEFGNEYYPE